MKKITSYKLQVTRNNHHIITSSPHLIILLLFCFSAFLPSSLFAQKLFTISENDMSQENVIQLKSQITQATISVLSLSRNNENKNVYAVPVFSSQNTKIIILNEQTGNHVVITPVENLNNEFQLAPFFMEELRQSALGEANRYVIVETQSIAYQTDENSQADEILVKNAYAVSVSHEDIYLPRYFYGEKGDLKEALPKERQIVDIYKQKPQFISAFPDNIENQQYIAQLEEDMSYYIYIYKLPDGTLCTYDEHFNPTQEKNISSVGNFLEFNLSGTLNDKQRLATEYSLELWSEQLVGTTPVDITVNMVSLGQGVLGMSFWPPCFLNPDTNIWYPSALWKQMKEGIVTENWDIFIVMNSDYNFYYGLDGNTGGMDFVTIMIHEITHGLGFGCYCSPDGYYFYEAPGIYDCMLYQGVNGTCFTELTANERAALMVSNNLYSGRPNSKLLKANNGVRVKMYAPTQYSGGSTAHHWDNNVGFVNFMQYAYQYPLHTFNNRKIGILCDMGYTVPVVDTANAVWLTFDNNGGIGNKAPQPFLPGEAQKIKINIFTKNGYFFTGWNTESDGSGISYSDRELISIDTDLKIYAQWEIAPYTLTFYPTQGTVSPKSKQVWYGFPIGEFPIPVRYGYKFDGWRIGFGAFLTEETIWTYLRDNTATAKWSVLTEIDENQNETTVHIYPNPTTGQLTIDNGQWTTAAPVGASSAKLITNVEIFDVYGRKVLEPPLTVLQSYDLTVLQSGLYFVKIETETGIITKKIIKQ